MRFLSILVACSLLSGCFGHKIDIDSEPIDRPALNIPEHAPVKMNSVEFLVVTPDNAEDIFQKLKEKSIVPVIFGLSGVYYKNLAVNLELLKQYILYQKEVIKIYKQYYDSEKPIVFKGRIKNGG
jgi:hypothetical protein